MTLAGYIVGLWIYSNIGFPPAKDNSVFMFYPRAQKTFALKDMQEGHHPESCFMVTPGLCQHGAPPRSRFHSQVQDGMQ